MKEKNKNIAERRLSLQHKGGETLKKTNKQKCLEIYISGLRLVSKKNGMNKLKTDMEDKQRGLSMCLSSTPKEEK